MTRKTSRAPRKPSTPPPPRPQPRRPSSGAMAPGAAAAPVARSEADVAHEYDHVKRDLTRIAVIGAALLLLILLAPRILP